MHWKQFLTDSPHYLNGYPPHWFPQLTQFVQLLDYDPEIEEQANRAVVALVSCGKQLYFLVSWGKQSVGRLGSVR